MKTCSLYSIVWIGLSVLTKRECKRNYYTLVLNNLNEFLVFHCPLWFWYCFSWLINEWFCLLFEWLFGHSFLHLHLFPFEIAFWFLSLVFCSFVCWWQFSLHHSRVRWPFQWDFFSLNGVEECKIKTLKKRIESS